MRYTPQLYAQALFEALEEQPKDRDRIIHRFLALVGRRGDARFLPKIFTRLEALVVRSEGGRVGRFATARPLPERELKRVRAAFGDRDRFHSEIRPDLIAGVKIIIDDEWVIDATMKRKLQKLFL